MCAYRGIPLQSAYCGAKHAMQGFSESVRCKLLHDRSNVHISRPGPRPLIFSTNFLLERACSRPLRTTSSASSFKPSDWRSVRQAFPSCQLPRDDRRRFGGRDRIERRRFERFPRMVHRCRECPRQDSNLRTTLRRRVLYPLSYGGARRPTLEHRVAHSRGRMCGRVSRISAGFRPRVVVRESRGW